MAEQKSVFMPDTLEPAQGPFTNVLTSHLVPDPPKPNPHGRITPAAAVLSIGESFLKGAADGRLRNFQMEENERAKKYAELNQFYQRVMADPTLTDEAKSHATQQIMQTFGGHLAEATGQAQKGGKGKKGKGGEEDKGGIGKHVTGMLHDLAVGMTGGKMPSGTKDLGDVYGVMGKLQAELYGPDNAQKYNKTAIINTSIQDLQKAMSGLDPKTTSQEEALRIATPHFQRVEELDAPRARSLRTDYLSQFQGVGSPEFKEAQLAKAFEAPPRVDSEKSPVAAAKFSIGLSPDDQEIFRGLRATDLNTRRADIQRPDGSHVNSMRMYGPGSEALSPPNPSPPQAESPNAPPPPLDSAQFTLLQMAGKDHMSPMKQVSYVDPKTGKSVEVEASLVSPPGRRPWYYAGDTPLPVPPSEVRGASTALPRVERWSPDKVVKDMASPTGWSYVSRNLDDSKAPERRTAGAPPPASTVARPLNAEQEARMKLINQEVADKQRVANAHDALTKVLEFTADPGDDQHKGKSYLEWVRDEALRPDKQGATWHQDKLVGPAMEGVRKLIDGMIVQERGKSRTDAQKMLQQQSGEIKQDLTNSRTQQSIHQAVGDLAPALVERLTHHFNTVWEQAPAGQQQDEDPYLSGSGSGAPSAPPRVEQSAPPPASADSWEVGGVTYKKGQEVRSNGKHYRVVGVKDGKLEVEPVGQ